jgi:glutamine---fructose-6-phosphate transaminase (isomerizing)
MKSVDRWLKVLNGWRHYFFPAALILRIKQAGCLPVYWGRCPEGIRGPVLVLFPYSATLLGCGLAGLITVRNRPKAQPADSDWQALESLARESMAYPLEKCLSDNNLAATFLGGVDTLDRLHALACELKREDYFLALFNDPERQKHLTDLARELTAFSQQEIQALQRRLGHLKAGDAETADQRVEKLKDVVWCLRIELLDNLRRVRELLNESVPSVADQQVAILRNINAVLNSIDRQEVRGRDSAGISLLFILAPDTYREFEAGVNRLGLADPFKHRLEREVLSNASIGVHHNPQTGGAGVTFTYKVAAEIGCLGDNMRCLRREIAGDPILAEIARLPHLYHTASAHTRWASVGAITIANCHPVDNATKSHPAAKGMIHACLNGDIDNYLALKKTLGSLRRDHPRGDHHRHQDHSPADRALICARGWTVGEAFRRAVQRFRRLACHRHAHRPGAGQVLPGPERQRPGGFRRPGQGSLPAHFRSLRLRRTNLALH